MKKIFLSLLVTLIVFCASCNTPKSELGIRGKAEGCSALLEGLQQFPYPYSYDDGSSYVLATLLSWHGPEKVKIEGETLDAYILELITRSGHELHVKVTSTEINLAILMHEISPYMGEHRFWNPVLRIKLRKEIGKANDLWCYDWHEVYLDGRFFIVWDKDDPSKISEYKNEVYSF